MNILLCSIGRRPYLVRWFQRALKENGVKGSVIAADMDAHAPSRAFADEFLLAPAVSSDEYFDWLTDVLEKRKIFLAISVNDFELSTWANLPDSPDLEVLVRLDSETQEIVEDKLRMASRLKEMQVSSPRTWSGSDAKELLKEKSSFVTKGRFGSASRGLRFANAQSLEAALEEATSEVTTRDGVQAAHQNRYLPEELIVIQERIEGQEFGLDVICDFKGNFVSVLARRKISMRGGETDKAASVDPEVFREIAEQISRAVPHRGLIDVDVIVDDFGKIFVIDINPRFGGGYPFSHLAGAQVPSAYVAWGIGKIPDQLWLESKPGVSSSKYVETAVVE